MPAELYNFDALLDLVSRDRIAPPADRIVSWPVPACEARGLESWVGQIAASLDSPGFEPGNASQQAVPLGGDVRISLHNVYFSTSIAAGSARFEVLRPPLCDGNND